MGPEQENNSDGETKELPLDELVLSAPSASGALPASESEDDEFEHDFSLSPKQPVIGEYLLLRRIGSGGNGRVFQARHRRMERIVALKMLSSGTMTDPEAVRRFRREMKAAAKLFHPNIVTAFDAGEHSGVHYLVMEYVDGMSLASLVERHGPVTVEKAVDYIIQAANGLQYAHSHNVVHRDIKPSNLIFDEQGVVKILDMGTARFENDGDLTQTGVIMGTVNYMSPEQARNATDVDPRTDIYSLGCTLFFLLTGRPLFDGNVMEVLIAHAETPPPSLRDLRPEVPRWLDNAFQRMVAKRVDDRQPSMESLAAELAEEQVIASDAGRHRGRAHHRATLIPLGIDIGYSQMGMACVEKGQLTTLRHQDSSTVPTCVRLEGMTISIGRPALERVGDYQHVARGIKRHIGEPLLDREIDGAKYPPEALLALILARLASDAQAHIDGAFLEAVAVVPASYDDSKRKAFEDVGRIAGLEIVDLINEPTAATLATICSDAFNKLHKPVKIMCVDLGGGKLDIGLYQFAPPGELTALAIQGTESVGGVEWDRRIVEMMADQIVASDGADPRLEPGGRAAITRNCELAKLQISKHGEASLAFNTPQKRIQWKLSLDRFTAVTKDLAQRVEDEIRETIAFAGEDSGPIDVVILTGQATRTPGIVPRVKAIVGPQATFHQIGPGAAARGAALQADFLRLRQLGRQPPIVVTDLAANSLGIVGIESHTQRRCNAILIPKGTKLPAATRKRFKTFRPGQDSLMIQMLQGESPDADQCGHVGKCVITDLPPELPTGTQFDVEFQCASSGRVTVFVENAELGFRVTRELTRPDTINNQQLSRWREWVETMTLCSTLG